MSDDDATALTLTPHLRRRPAAGPSGTEALEACAYIRVSTNLQAEGISPDLQRRAVRELAAREGRILRDDLIFSDTERGGTISRLGYQQLLAAVRRKEASAVYVYCFDRWGRDGVEWAARAQELRTRHIPLISVQEGREEGGIMTFVRAGLYQWYSEQLAHKVIGPKRDYARQGIHQGPTPLGYRREYPAWDGTGRRPRALLLIDEATAWVIRELYRRYDEGASKAELAAWLNSDPLAPPPARGARGYTPDRVADLLANATYAGYVLYDRRPSGRYAHAEPGSAFCVPGQHPAIVEPVLFQRVQERLAAGSVRRGRARVRRGTALGTGLLVCAECGGPMIRQVAGITHPERPRPSVSAPCYLCLWRKKRTSPTCTHRGYSAPVAHAALLGELARLRGHDWTPQAEDCLAGDAPDAAVRARELERAIETERATLRRQARALLQIGDLGEEAVAAFRAIGGQAERTIAAMEVQRAGLAQAAVPVADLRTLHQRLTTVEIPALVVRLAPESDAADTAAARALLLACIQSARVIDRQPAHHATWLRLDVTWTPDVCRLLDAGLLTLDPPTPPPQRSARQDAQRRASQRWRDKRRCATEQQTSSE